MENTKPYGFCCWINGMMLYRLRYTNIELCQKVLLYFKSCGLHGITHTYISKDGPTIEIEVLTPAKLFIEKAKLFTIEANISKLQNKKKEIINSLF